MANRVNLAMVEEYRSRIGEAPDLVAVDMTGLSVAEISEFRVQARAQQVDVFVVKTSLARLALKEAVVDDGLEQVLKGPTAVILGGESLPDLVRLVDGYSKKIGNKLAVRGGLFEKGVIPASDVLKFKDIPDRKTLLSQILATLIAPMTGTLAAVNTLLTAPAALADALEKKMGAGDS